MGSEGGPLFNDIDSIAAIKVFLGLVDNHATVKQYQIKFGWSRDTLTYKLTQTNMYRRTLLASQKIEKLMSENKGEFDDIRSEVNRLRSLMWRDGPTDEV
jgi:hypothetical protein